jgi:hypothetical protein
MAGKERALPGSFFSQGDLPEKIWVPALLPEICRQILDAMEKVAPFESR